MKLGVEYGKVSLSPHDDSWKEIATDTIRVLEKILGDTAISIQHVGSTSIRGIPAKPIIDIAVGVETPACVYRFEQPLAEAGIHIVGELVPGQIMCDEKTEEGLEGKHIHFVTYGCQAWWEYIHFRDYLNGSGTGKAVCGSEAGAGEEVRGRPEELHRRQGGADQGAAAGRKGMGRAGA